MTPKLNRAFATLRKKGYFARQTWKCCSSCGWAALPEDKVEKAVFYHRQDRDHLESKGETYLAWSGDPEEIAQAFRCEGLTVVHDGSSSTRILVKL